MYCGVTIGWTKSDRENGYSSFDGYRPGAEQHTEYLAIQITTSTRIDSAADAICNAAFTALNDPFPSMLTGVARQIWEKVHATGYRGEGAHYSLSVGDTVTVDNVMFACEPTGWKQITPTFGVWRGGFANYAPSYVDEDVEFFDSLHDAIHAMQSRITVGHWQPQHFEFLSKESSDALTPCVTGSLMDIYLDDPRLSDDPIPDFQFEQLEDDTIGQYQ